MSSKISDAFASKLVENLKKSVKTVAMSQQWWCLYGGCYNNYPSGRGKRTDGFVFSTSSNSEVCASEYEINIT